MKKRLVASVMAMTMCLGGLVGCTTSSTPETDSGNTTTQTTTEKTETKKEETKKEETNDTLKPVELTWYFRAEPMVDQDKVFAEANKIIKEAINATVKFVPIAPGEYDQKMQTKYASGDAGDITWTSSWTNNFSQNIAKGAFIPINDLLDTYALQIKNSIPEEQWLPLMVGDDIYGIPNVQIFTKTNQTRIRKDYADKYGLDVANIQTLEDLEPWLESLRAGETKDVVIEWNNQGRFNNLLQYYGFDTFSDATGIRVDDQSLEVINIFDTEEFKGHIQLAKRWADAGHIASDAMTKKDQEAEKKAGKITGDIRGNNKPGEAAEAAAQWGTEMYVIPISEAILNTGGITSTINAITTTSKNPERAMMLLEMVNTNSELYNLIVFGIEGEHYEKIGDNTIRYTENKSKYNFPNWIIGNVTKGYLVEGQPETTWEETIEMNNTAKKSPALGFTFDAMPVKTQIAQVKTIIDEYLPGLGCGVVDIDKVYPEFLSKLQSAGIDEIIAETQRQIDAWR